MESARTGAASPSRAAPPSVEDPVAEDLVELFRDADYLQVLSDDLQKFCCIHGDKFSDAKVITCDSFFRVHKVILAARSSVFAAMFDPESEFKEGREGIVRIPDISTKIVLVMLEYVYAAYIKSARKLDLEELLELAYAADKYDLPDLRKFCDEEAARRITKENASTEILSFAEKLGLRKTTGAVLSFIDKKEKKEKKENKKMRDPDGIEEEPLRRSKRQKKKRDSDENEEESLRRSKRQKKRRDSDENEEETLRKSKLQKK